VIKIQEQTGQKTRKKGIEERENCEERETKKNK